MNSYTAGKTHLISKNFIIASIHIVALSLPPEIGDLVFCLSTVNLKVLNSCLSLVSFI